MPARCEEHGADPMGLPRFSLSRRQREVLTHAGRGQTCRQIATQLAIAPQTVRHHLDRIRRRLGAVNTIHAVVLAIARDEIQVSSILEE